MTKEALEVFLKLNPNCAICGAEGEVIDHCHVSGAVRGHLCRTCNSGLGMFKDRQDLLAKAATYLRNSV